MRNLSLSLSRSLSFFLALSLALPLCFSVSLAGRWVCASVVLNDGEIRQSDYIAYAKQVYLFIPLATCLSCPQFRTDCCVSIINQLLSGNDVCNPLSVGRWSRAPLEDVISSRWAISH